MTSFHSIYLVERAEWRAWLEDHFQTEKEIWLELPKKASGKPCLLYNDAVEEALCFGWIDSQRRALDADTGMQRYTPRRKGSGYSQANVERLRWLLARELVHPSLVEEVRVVVERPFVYPEDVVEALQAMPGAWEQFQSFPEGYQRIRLAYVDAARKRPEEFQKRLDNLVAKSHEGKMIRGHGGIEKHY